MDTWTNLTNELMKAEILQLEMLCQQLIESLPIIIVCTIVLVFGLMGLLAAIDCIFREDRDLPQSCRGSETEEQYPDSSRDKFSQPATRLLMNDTNAAA